MRPTSRQESVNAASASTTKRSSVRISLTKNGGRVPYFPQIGVTEAGADVLASKDNVWAVRIGIHCRALGEKRDESIRWFWIGHYAEYDRLTR